MTCDSIEAGVIDAPDSLLTASEETGDLTLAHAVRPDEVQNEGLTTGQKVAAHTFIYARTAVAEEASVRWRRRTGECRPTSTDLLAEVNGKKAADTTRLGGGGENESVARHNAFCWRR